MYCAYDQNENIVALHDKRYVIEKYVDTIYSLHKVQLNIGKVKKSSKYKVTTKDDLYLIRFGDVYVQAGYLLYVELSQTQIMEDDQFALDILYRLLETRRLTEKQSKKIMKAIEVMEDLVHEDREYVPTIDNLKTMKNDYDPYIYNTRLIDKI